MVGQTLTQEDTTAVINMKALVRAFMDALTTAMSEGAGLARTIRYLADAGEHKNLAKIAEAAKEVGAAYVDTTVAGNDVVRLPGDVAEEIIDGERYFGAVYPVEWQGRIAAALESFLASLGIPAAVFTNVFDYCPDYGRYCLVIGFDEDDPLEPTAVYLASLPYKDLSDLTEDEVRDFVLAGFKELESGDVIILWDNV